MFTKKDLELAEYYKNNPKSIVENTSEAIQLKIIEMEMLNYIVLFIRKIGNKAVIYYK